MKRGFFAFLCVMMFFCGCADGSKRLQTIMDNPREMLRDPHFSEYQKKADALEDCYLKKEISYAEYLEQKKELEQTYDYEVKKRNEIISAEK